MNAAGVFDPRPVTLHGRGVLLEPLAERHAPDLAEAGRDGEIWTYVACAPVVTLEAARSWIAGALAEQDRGARIPFAIVEPGGRAIGSTSYLDIRREHRALEIGWTWLAGSRQRTHVNTACKLALLAHAFEDLGALRVQFKTDARNERSQRAIARLGAAREGVLRKTLIMPDGYERDSVYFSIVAPEWPAARRRLESLLAER